MALKLRRWLLGADELELAADCSESEEPGLAGDIKPEEGPVAEGRERKLGGFERT